MTPTEANAPPLERGPHRRRPPQAGDLTNLQPGRRQHRPVAQPRAVGGAAQGRRIVPMPSTTQVALPRRTRGSQPHDGATARRSDIPARSTHDFWQPALATLATGHPNAKGRATRPARVPTTPKGDDLDLQRSRRRAYNAHARADGRAFEYCTGLADGHWSSQPAGTTDRLPPNRSAAPPRAATPSSHRTGAPCTEQNLAFLSVVERP
jgi:hypothetical protein